MQRVVRAKRVDVEAWEWAIREAVLCAGARVLERMLRRVCSGRRDEPVVCRCAARMESRGVRYKQVMTILGPLRIGRSMFQCPSCARTRYPADEELDVVDTLSSPALRRVMARMGSKSPFQEASEDIKVCAGVRVNAKTVERVAESVGEDMQRWHTAEREAAVRHYQRQAVSKDKTIATLYIEMDGTGVPMTRRELIGRRGKQSDGSARTREVKLGCVFTQTTTDKQGRPRRDPASTTFVGKIESADEFGERLFAEAVRRGLDEAEQIVVLGDGATWITGIVETHFPNATQIIDLYHAREHVSDLAKALFACDEAKIVQYRDRWWASLDEGEVEKIVTDAKRSFPRNRDRRKRAKSETAYLHSNKERMRYAHFRARGLFIGSGVVEAGCKSVIAQRLKQSGMQWSLRGANAIITLRCMLKSRRLEDYWEARAG